MKPELQRFTMTPELQTQLNEGLADISARINALPEVLRYTAARELMIQLCASILGAAGPEITIEFLQEGIDSVHMAQELTAQAAATMTSNPSSGLH